jgi:hypothetical protein
VVFAEITPPVNGKKLLFTYSVVVYDALFALYVVYAEFPFFVDGDEAALRPMILKDIAEKIDMDISTEDDFIIRGMNTCKKLYETPTYRTYVGIKSMLDRLAHYMETTEIQGGRDGNITALVNAAAKFDQIRQSFKGAYKDLAEEQQSQVRGNIGLAYDQ